MLIMQIWNVTGMQIKITFMPNQAPDGVNLDRFCFIGRAPISNREEAQTFAEKVLNYERLDTAQINPNYVLNLF